VAATLRNAALVTALAVSIGVTNAPAQSAWPDPAVDSVHLLDDRPFGFLYELPVPEWPAGWSFHAASPNEISVYQDEWSFADPFTGAPRFDLVPSQLARAPSVGFSTRPGGTAVRFDLHPFDIARPLTDAMYWTSDKGLQSVRIVHVQRRVFGAQLPDSSATPAPAESLAADSTSMTPAADALVASDSMSAAGSPREATVAFTYHGAAASGEYPGSRVRRARQVGGFVELAGQRWSVQLFDLFNRRSVGAHGGVNPPVFERLDASVRNPTAIRETRRNDLALGATLRILETPTRLGAVWTEATSRYAASADTVEARTRTFSWHARHDVLSSIPVALVARGSVADLIGVRGMQPSESSVAELFAGIESGYDSKSVKLTGNVGYASIRGRGILAVQSAISLFTGPLTFSVRGVRAALRQPLVQTTGFGGHLAPPGSIGETATTTRFESRIGLSTDVLRVELSAFVASNEDAIDYLATATEDSAVVARVASPTMGGFSVGISLRESAAAGVYLSARVDSYTRLTSTAAPPESPHSHDRVARALPDYFASARAGLRQTLFRGDLAGDVFVRGRAWPAFGGRELHPQTGLLVVPMLGSEVPAAGVVDIGVSAGIRTATIYLLYENMLSGTELQDGVMMVDGYPLEERRVRFGVHWPISG